MKTRILSIFAVVCCMAFLGGCESVNERLDSMDGNPVYEIGKIGFHLTVRSEAAELMTGYLDDHPESVDRLPLLSMAWDHFWDGDNPFDRDAFDAWASDQATKLGATEVERASLEDAAELLWTYLEADADGYVRVDDRSRRIVDSLVHGLRLGYRQWVSEHEG